MRDIQPQELAEIKKDLDDAQRLELIEFLDERLDDLIAVPHRLNKDDAHLKLGLDYLIRALGGVLDPEGHYQ